MVVMFLKENRKTSGPWNLAMSLFVPLTARYNHTIEQSTLVLYVEKSAMF